MTRFVLENKRYPTRFECLEIPWLFNVNVYFKLLGPMRSLTILEELYEKEPVLCKCCDKKIIFKKRQNTFCSASCIAKFYNKLRTPKQKEKPLKKIIVDGTEQWLPSVENCLNCCKELEQTQKFFCTLSCQADHKFSIKLDSWLKTGKASDNKAIRKYITHLDGYSCSCCGLSEWNNKPITLEVEHISGNSEDDTRENVCLICPNCHSQTDTYKGKNRGNGRHARAQRYRDGKSY